MRKINIVTSVAFASLLMSCKTLPDVMETSHAKSQEEAGSVNIAMMPLIPWDDIAQKLQPNFAMKTADEALARVLPVTQAEDYRRSRKFGAGLGVNLAGSSTSKLSEFTQSEVFGNNPSITASENTSISRAFEPGTRPDVSAALPGGSLMTDQLLNAFAPNMDPFLQYRSATALYQEVKILNQYLQGVDEFRGYTPFLARVQLTINPYKRNLPYDVYTTITFDTRYDNEGEEQKLKVIPLVISDNLERSDQRRMAEAVSQLGLNISAMVAGTGVGGDLKSQIESLKNLTGRDYNSTKSLSKLDASTLLVRTGAAYAGSSEVSMTPRSYDITFLLMLLDEGADSNQPIKLTISDNAKDTNGGGDPKSLEEIFELEDGEKNNILSQISSVKLKAAFDAEMNYNDPNKWTLSVFALPEFRHSTTGKPLPVWGRIKLAQAHLLKNEKIKGLNQGDTQSIYNKIKNNFASLEQPDFEKIIRTLDTSDPHLKSDIDRLFKLKYGAYDDIDVFKTPVEFSKNTSVNFKDDGKTALTVVLPPSKGLSQKRLEATLKVVLPPKQEFKKTRKVIVCLTEASNCTEGEPILKDKKLQYEEKFVATEEKEFEFSATGIALDSAGRVKLEFPSLVALNLERYKLSAAAYTLNLNYVRKVNNKPIKTPSPAYILVKNTAASVKPKAKDWFKFGALIKTVTAKDAQGKIYLSVETKDEEIKPGVKQTVPLMISVKNAILDDVKAMKGQIIKSENLKLVREKNAFIISQTAGVVIDVSQLVKGSEVEITATAVKLDKKGKAKTKPGSAKPKVVKVKIIVPALKPKP